MTEATPQAQADPEGAAAALAPAARPAPFQQDVFLEALVEGVNVYGIAWDLTLCVGGLLITGELVSTEVFFRALGEEVDRAISSHLGEEPTGKHAAPYFQLADESKVAWQKKQENRTADDPSPAYICLRNARYFNPSGDSVPGHDGVHWRGKLSAVDGWSFGRLVPSPAPASAGVRGRRARG